MKVLYKTLISCETKFFLKRYIQHATVNDRYYLGAGVKLRPAAEKCGDYYASVITHYLIHNAIKKLAAFKHSNF
jgi:uncharacterized membrane protein